MTNTIPWRFASIPKKGQPLSVVPQKEKRKTKGPRNGALTIQVTNLLSDDGTEGDSMSS